MNGTIGSSVNAQSRVEEELGQKSEPKMFQQPMVASHVMELLLLKKSATFKNARVISNYGLLYKYFSYWYKLDSSKNLIIIPKNIEIKQSIVNGVIGSMELALQHVESVLERTRELNWLKKPTEELALENLLKLFSVTKENAPQTKTVYIFFVFHRLKHI